LRGFIGILNQCNVIVGNGGATNMAKALGKPSFFSPWIEKKIWATLEDGIHHLSVHLNDYNQVTVKTEKNLNRMLLPYIKFKPTLFKEKLKSFLLNILSN
jgi:heptosyltransferase-2